MYINLLLNIEDGQTYPALVAFCLVLVVPSADELSCPPVVNSNACLHCSAKQLKEKELAVNSRGRRELCCYV